MNGRNVLLRMIQLRQIVLLAAACGEPAVTPTPDSLAGGVLATFDVYGEQFHVWVTNPKTIQEILDLQRRKHKANIPVGRVLRGSGQGRHNAPWSWHIDSGDIGMAEMAPEVCDGLPSHVEEYIDDFPGGYYYPCAAKLVDIQDHR